MKIFAAHFNKFPMDQWDWPDFSPREMASKGEGELLIDTVAMDRLQALRDRLGKPMLITSAYRSPAHNKRVGGAKRSKHLDAIAFDVRMENHDPHVFEAAARAVGFTGFGYYRNSGFMHIDTGPERSWGKPWPETHIGLPVEPPKQPASLSEDRETQAVAGASVAGGLAVAMDHMPAAGSLLGNLAPTAQLVAVGVAAVFIGYLLLKRAR